MGIYCLFAALKRVAPSLPFIEQARRAAARNHKRKRSSHLVLYFAVVLSAMR